MTDDVAALHAALAAREERIAELEIAFEHVAARVEAQHAELQRCAAVAAERERVVAELPVAAAPEAPVSAPPPVAAPPAAARPAPAPSVAVRLRARLQRS